MPRGGAVTKILEVTGDNVKTISHGGSRVTARSCLDQACVHVAYRLLQPDEYGAGDDAVTDVQLDHVVDLGDRSDVLVVQPVPGVQREAPGHGLGAGEDQRAQLAGLLVGRGRVGVPAGV